MSDDRFVILGLASVRSTWFRDLSRWSTTAVVPVDFVKCVSVEEVRARLDSGRAFSALILDGSLPYVDRDLLDSARSVAAAPIIVEDPLRARDWIALGAAAVLPPEFSRDDLLGALRHHASPIVRTNTVSTALPVEERGRWKGRFITVTGPPGMGSSVTAISLAQGLSADPRNRRLVALADLCLDADLAMYHDARDIIPGLQEYVEAHRTGRLDGAAVRRSLFHVSERDYDLLLGLRRHRDWTAIRSRSLDAALDNLRANYRFVIADVGSDLEGEASTGSIDIEERNLLTRSAIRLADLIVVVGTADIKGLHRLTRLIGELDDAGIPRSRLLTVLNRAPRSPKLRAELTKALADLTARGETLHGDAGVVMFIPERKRLGDNLRDGTPLPEALTDNISTAVTSHLDSAAATIGSASSYERVRPGSLGSWSEDELVP